MWEGFVSLVFIHGISPSAHGGHDHVHIHVVLNNEHTLMNFHNSFHFFPSLVLPMKQHVS
jgi:hypothetical protein